MYSFINNKALSIGESSYFVDELMDVILYLK